MTHDHGGAAVIGGGAALVLIADVIYAGMHWSGPFSRSFLIALGGLLACAVVTFGLRLGRPVGGDRRAARFNQRGPNFVLVVALVLFLEIGNQFGGNGAGEILGAVAGLAAFFVMFT